MSVENVKGSTNTKTSIKLSGSYTNALAVFLFHFFWAVISYLKNCCGFFENKINQSEMVKWCCDVISFMELVHRQVF